MPASLNCTIASPAAIPPDAMRSYEQAIETTLPTLLRIARRLTWPDQDLGADLVQDAVLKGLRSLKSGKLEITPNVGAWLKQAVYLEFLMHKRNSKRLTYLESETFDQQCATNPKPFSSEISPEIERALAELPDDQRILIILVDIEEHEYQEVSNMLNIPMGTVRSRLSRARWKLANRLHHLAGNQS